MVPANPVQAQRTLELAIERAFFLPGTAAHFAAVFSTGARQLHASDVRKIWDAAKDRGDIPRINRPKGGPRDRERVPA